MVGLLEHLVRRVLLPQLVMSTRSGGRPTKPLNETALDPECLSRYQDIHPIGEHCLRSAHSLPSGYDLDLLLWVRPLTVEVDPIGTRAEPCRDEIRTIPATNDEDIGHAMVVNRQFREFLAIQGQNHELNRWPRPFEALIPIKVGSKQGPPPSPNLRLFTCAAGISRVPGRRGLPRTRPAAAQVQRAVRRYAFRQGCANVRRTSSRAGSPRSRLRRPPQPRGMVRPTGGRRSWIA